MRAVLFSRRDAGGACASNRRSQTTSANGQENRLFTLAQNIWSEHYGRSGISLSIVADSVEDLAAKLDKASDAVTSTKHLSGKDPQGVYYYPDAR